MNLELKLIDCKDLNRLSALFFENNVPIVTNTFLPFPLTHTTAKWIACEPHQDRFFICTLNDKVIGFSMLRGWEEGYSIPSFGMFVDYRFHGKGIGKDLLKLTIAEAKRLNCEEVRLSVFASNLAAWKIYHDIGFMEVERIAAEDGLDAKIIMTKKLR